MEPEKTTLWSRVLVAADPKNPDRREALDALIRSHWPSVYLLFRRMGVAADEAPDLTQDFFGWLIEGEALRAADPERGRFRAFLKTVARNFLLHELEKARALKRGGGARPLSLNFDGMEKSMEPAGPETPERAFDRRWALDLLQASVEELEEEMKKTGQQTLFLALRGAFALDGPPELPTYARVATQLAIREPEVASFVFRARRRLREILTEHVRASVANDSDVEDEVRQLFAALAP